MKILSLLLVLLLAPAAFAQDLDRLRSRAEDLWKHRVAGDKIKAVPFVEPDSRDRLSNVADPNLKDATIIAFNFSRDSREVLVKVRLRVTSTIGDLNKDVEERWVWTGGNWFLRLGPSAPSNLFEANTQVSLGTPRVDIEVMQPQLEPGNYVQGSQITGSIPFTAKKSELIAIGAEGIPGLSVKEVHWRDESGGTIEFVINTALISKSIAQPIRFIAIGKGGTRTPSKPVDIRATIAGLVEFSQIPEAPDFRTGGQVQIVMKNLRDRPLAITAVSTSRPDYTVKENEAPVGDILRIAPGETGRLTIEHPAHTQRPEPEVVISFADGLFPQPVTFPLRFLMPRVEEQPLVDPALLQEILRKQGRPPI
jgi:hypothetical protein